MRLPGIEPGSNAWEASMIAITLQAAGILPKMSRTSRFRFFYSLAAKKNYSHRGTRTHDHKIKGLALYQLS